MKKELEERILSFIDKTIEELREVVPEIGTIRVSLSAKITEAKLTGQGLYHFKGSVYAIADLLGNKGLEYKEQLQTIFTKYEDSRPDLALDCCIGILTSLRERIKLGLLLEIEELISGNIFSDFLSQAKYLLSNDYKTAAAVIAGIVLESHLRNVCIKENVSIVKNKNNKDIPLTAGSLKDALIRSKIISSSDANQITVWLDIRNNAAHGHHENFSKEQVNIMIEGISLFISQYIK